MKNAIVEKCDKERESIQKCIGLIMTREKTV